MVTRFWTAFATGWVIYMIAMAMTVYAGALSLCCQPFCAAIVSGVVSGLALLVGLPLRLPGVRDLWFSSAIPWSMLVGFAFLLLCFFPLVGPQVTYTNPETQQSFGGPHPVPILAGYLLAVFTAAYWPDPVGTWARDTFLRTST